MYADDGSDDDIPKSGVVGVSWIRRRNTWQIRYTEAAGLRKVKHMDPAPCSEDMLDFETTVADMLVEAKQWRQENHHSPEKKTRSKTKPVVDQPEEQLFDPNNP